MKHAVSIVPYANMTPFRIAGPPEGCQFVNLDPRRSTEALRHRSIVAAPLPVGDLPSVDGVVEFIGNYGVAAAGAVRSVLLFSDLPPEKLTPPLCIHLTDQSSSSVRLLHLLLGYRNGFDRMPYRSPVRESAVAELHIGDDALRIAAEPPRRHVIDLAEEWFRVHRLPFVFARWVVRADAPAACRESLERWLAEFGERDAEHVRACAAAEADRLGTGEEEMHAYLSNMKRVLGPTELEGQEMFLRELERHGRDPLFPAGTEISV
jgi:chorismate dehydratase